MLSHGNGVSSREAACPKTLRFGNKGRNQPFSAAQDGKWPHGTDFRRTGGIFAARAGFSSHGADFCRTGRIFGARKRFLPHGTGGVRARGGFSAHGRFEDGLHLAAAGGAAWLCRRGKKRAEADVVRAVGIHWGQSRFLRKVFPDARQAARTRDVKVIHAGGFTDMKPVVIIGAGVGRNCQTHRLAV
jgi:hypothetical protein